MIKCSERLAFVNEKGKVKDYFEIIYNENEAKVEGRRKQLIKKLLLKSIDEQWISPAEVFAFLKKNKKFNIITLSQFIFSKEADE